MIAIVIIIAIVNNSYCCAALRCAALRCAALRCAAQVSRRALHAIDRDQQWLTISN